VDPIVELTCGRNVEETVEELAVSTPDIPVMHEGYCPSAAHPETSRRLSVATDEYDNTYDSFAIGNRGW